ncbi:hypothetical protein EDB85DRAFT_2028096 [Lactarius pseudohatsudake]|nr:hypothetical protein EDB85DRAFT_2028096 [Lactarius pseudohatsudake]
MSSYLRMSRAWSRVYLVEGIGREIISKDCSRLQLFTPTYQIYRFSRKGLGPNCCPSSHHPWCVRAGETVQRLGQALQGGSCLTLLNVVHSRFPADEALYHSAATQYCESRSVKGPMRAIAVMDGQDRAQRFSTSMFPPQRVRRRLLRGGPSRRCMAGEEEAS